MPSYNLLEYSKNYRKTTGSLYNYYRDELDDDADLDNHPNNNVVSSSSFKYKSKLLGNTYNIDSTNDPAVAGGARLLILIMMRINLVQRGHSSCTIKIFW